MLSAPVPYTTSNWVRKTLRNKHQMRTTICLAIPGTVCLSSGTHQSEPTIPQDSMTIKDKPTLKAFGTVRCSLWTAVDIIRIFLCSARLPVCQYTRIACYYTHTHYVVRARTSLGLCQNRNSSNEEMETALRTGCGRSRRADFLYILSGFDKPGAPRQNRISSPPNRLHRFNGPSRYYARAAKVSRPPKSWSLP